MLADTIVPTVKVRSFPNEKPWVDGSIRGTLMPVLLPKTLALYPATVKDAKRRYRDRVEAQME